MVWTFVQLTGASGVALMWVWSHWEKCESGGCGRGESWSGLEGKNGSCRVGASKEWRGKDAVGGEPAEPGKLVADRLWVPFVQMWVNAELLRHLRGHLLCLESSAPLLMSEKPSLNRKPLGIFLRCCSLMSRIRPGHREQGCLWGGWQLGGTASGLPRPCRARLPALPM